MGLAAARLPPALLLSVSCAKFRETTGNSVFFEIFRNNGIGGAFHGHSQGTPARKSPRAFESHHGDRERGGKCHRHHEGALPAYGSRLCARHHGASGRRQEHADGQARERIPQAGQDRRRHRHRPDQPVFGRRHLGRPHPHGESGDGRRRIHPQHGDTRQLGRPFAQDGGRRQGDGRFWQGHYLCRDRRRRAIRGRHRSGSRYDDGRIDSRHGR